MRAAMAATLALVLVLAGCVAPAARRPALPAPAPEETLAAEPAAAPRLLAATIAGAPELSRFRALAAAGGLTTLIAGHGPVTVLAPTDAAFARLRPGTVEALLLPGNRPSLLHLLRFWIVPADGWSRATDRVGDFGSPPLLATSEGEPLTVRRGPDGVTLTDAGGRRSRATTVPATDGALVLLDGIVAPRSIEPGAGSR